MTKHATEWLKGWLDQNITYLDVGGDYIRAIEISDKCRAAAISEGVGIEEAVNGTLLESIIYSAMRKPTGGGP